MRHLKKHLLIVLLGLMSGVASFAQGAVSIAQGTASIAQGAADSLYTFRFVQGQDMFYVPWQGNGSQLEALVALLREYKEEVTSGRLPVQVDGYCTGLPSREENLRMAAVRSNRVKSELISRTGVTEACFTTANYNDTYRRQDNNTEDGKENDTHKGRLYDKVYEEMRNVVVVTLRLPRHAELAEASTPQAQAGEREGEEILHYVQNDRQEAQAVQQPKAQAQAAHPLSASQEKESASSASSADKKSPAHPDKKSPAHPADKIPSLSLRTNLLYDAFLLPTLGLEWRINPSVAIKLDGSLSLWGSSKDKVQKMWLLNPEARWYLLRDKRFYLGVSGSYGEYNIYKYMLGSLLKDDTGYQGNLWSAGLTVGYSLPLCRRLRLDFNLGLGYTRAEYDSFTLLDGIRTFKLRDESKSFWGPTQAGISLVWVIGEYK